jgi:hypothetical protein
MMKVSPLAQLLQDSPLASQAWRLQNLYTIRDADHKLVAFEPNLSQRRFYNRRWHCNHILKARKLGFSTFIELLYLDDLLFSPTGLRAGIIDFTLEDAKAKLAMAAAAYEHLDNAELHPETYKIGAVIKRCMQADIGRESISFANGSVITCSTSFRGSTPNRLHISELGKTSIKFPQKAQEIVNGAFNSMTPGNVRNIESTHEGGKTGVNYRLMDQAMKLDAESLTPIQSRFHFFPWYDDPRYQLMSETHKLRGQTREYFERMERDHGIVCSFAQMLWYDQKQSEQGHGMKREFPTTPGEAFEAIIDGAIYGEEMADLRAKGRVMNFGLEAGYPLFTFSDIGLSDYYSDWLIQPVGRHFLVLDWFEAEGLPGSRVPEHWKAWEQKYATLITRHFLPHDANTRDRGTGRTYLDELRMAGRHNLSAVPRTPDVWLGIGYVRDVLPHCYFHQTHCDTARRANGMLHDGTVDEEGRPSGVACLEGYSRGTRDTHTLREMPLHNDFSHSADAFRTFAEAWRAGLVRAGGEMERRPRAIR